MTRKIHAGFCFASVIALIAASTANAELYLMFNVGDNEDREVPDAGKILADAQDGIPPAVIDGNAERYVVHLPGATMDALSGSAVRVDNQRAAVEPAATMADAVSEGSGSASSTTDSGDTGWIEYSAHAASLMLFSPDGLDQESDIRFEPARVFLRRFADGSVYAAITGEDGEPPPAETTD